MAASHSAFERGDGVRGDGFSAPNFADAFVRFGLQVDSICGNTQRFRDSLAHRGEMRAKFGPLEDHDGVNVPDFPVSALQILADLAKEHQTRHAAPFLIRIWKMRADVAHSCRAEQSIANRMAQDIAVRVADRAFFKGNFDAANHEFAFLRESVKVVADSGA